MEYCDFKMVVAFCLLAFPGQGFFFRVLKWLTMEVVDTFLLICEEERLRLLEGLLTWVDRFQSHPRMEVREAMEEVSTEAMIARIRAVGVEGASPEEEGEGPDTAAEVLEALLVVALEEAATLEQDTPLGEEVADTLEV